MTRARAAAVAGLALALALPCVARADSAKAPLRYALIIANNHSLDKGVKPLRYADDDAVRYYELFKLSTNKVALFTVLDDESARLFPGAQQVAKPPRAADIFATLARWNAEMAALKKAGRETELFVIYAGHGDRTKSGEGYVNLLDKRLLRRDLYRKVLAPSTASFVHLIIDACKSYFLVNRRGGSTGWKDDGGGSEHDAEINAFLKREELSAYPNAGVILATSGDQSTHEWTRYRGGILSHELRSAIAGAADINGDGRVEYSELHAFIAAANARIKHPEAKLNIFAHAPAANRRRPLMDLRAARSARLLRFDRQVSGQFHLEDDRGVRVADLNKAAGVRFDLAVDRQRTYYLRRAHKEAKVAPGAARVRVGKLAWASTAMAARAGSLEQSFRRDLYRLAYSRGFYEGFCAQAGHTPVDGKAVEWVIRRNGGGGDGGGDDPSALRRHSLVLGYMATAALLDLDGVSHGLQLRYDLGIHRYVTVGALFEYGGSAHTQTLDQFTLHRVAAMASVSGRLPLGSRVVIRAELDLGYQGYFSSGNMTIKGRRISGNDSLGFRMELAAGARVLLTEWLFADVRGGIGIELVTIEPEELANTAPFFAIGIGTRF
ncbi:MAG: caspase family protein [Myxococcales bacterium]|nr:caspase family protein [Myxococcales bacterium]